MQPLRETRLGITQSCTDLSLIYSTQDTDLTDILATDIDLYFRNGRSIPEKVT